MRVVRLVTSSSRFFRLSSHSGLRPVSPLSPAPRPIATRRAYGVYGSSESKTDIDGELELMIPCFLVTSVPCPSGSFSLGPSRLVSRVPRPSVALRNRLRSFASHGAPAVRSPRSLPAPYLPPRPPTPEGPLSRRAEGKGRGPPHTPHGLRLSRRLVVGAVRYAEPGSRRPPSPRLRPDRWRLRRA